MLSFQVKSNSTFIVSFLERDKITRTKKPEHLKLLWINWIYHHYSVTGIHWSLLLSLFWALYSVVWKWCKQRVRALAAYSSESCSVHKNVSCKLEVIMLHLPQNHLSEDSYKLKCLNSIKRRNNLFSDLFI